MLVNINISQPMQMLTNAKFWWEMLTNYIKQSFNKSYQIVTNVNKCYQILAYGHKC